MTADKKPKHSEAEALDDAQKQLEGLDLKEKKRTNVVDHQLPERECEGRISIELGEITQHNLMVRRNPKTPLKFVDFSK